MTKKRDDEKLIWLIVGGIFTVALIGIDLGYSSYPEMATALKWLLYIGHAALAFLWLLVMVNFKDPNFDYLRKYTLYVAIGLILIVGIHHATSVEDKQVIIDSRENATKDTLK